MIAAAVLFVLALAVVVNRWSRARDEVEYQRERTDLEEWVEVIRRD